MLKFIYPKIITITTFCFGLFFANTAKAQLELKTNPFIFPFGPFTLAAEVGVNKDVGLELATYFDTDDNSIIYLNGKYYFNERRGMDGFHIGAFAGAANKDAGLGFLLGYKWVSRHNILFEIGGGLGRTFGSNNDDDFEALPYLRLDVGYRFNFRKKGDTK